MKLLPGILFIIIASNSFCIAKNELQHPAFKLPVLVKDRHNCDLISLTRIGHFGEKRKERTSVPAHLHTGIDIVRPSGNYESEPVFSIYPGKVISLRNDGPFAQIIIEHSFGNGNKLWSVYEHIAGIAVKIGEQVDSEKAIARFMNKNELNKFGWQFDHVHFEILKVAPQKVKFSPTLPNRFFSTYNIECYTQETLRKYYFDPFEFFHSFSAINYHNSIKK
jgi:Peptidase family M23